MRDLVVVVPDLHEAHSVCDTALHWLCEASAAAAIEALFMCLGPISFAKLLTAYKVVAIRFAFSVLTV